MFFRLIQALVRTMKSWPAEPASFQLMRRIRR